MRAEEIVYPSIYSADQLFLYDELRRVEKAGYKILHIDIQDGVFCSNLSFGMKVVKGLRKYTSMPFQVHLQVMDPMSYIYQLKDIPNICEIIFHPSVEAYPGRVINTIKDMGIEAGFALTPTEPLEELQYYKGRIKSMLLWTSEADNRGAAFDINSLQKIKRTRNLFGKDLLIYTDGGINSQNLSLVLEAGADGFVMGREIFDSEDILVKTEELNEIFLRKSYIKPIRRG
ncbi:ribulose-phosphate 3-epimerase [Alloiococcus sp. CFN-8]|uniref:ribulose-phosphate 3-epimerase n=1 Tax=Alloiococcus sp. CFN-8 TaxID=3416081 RepID=UPI003CEB51D5